MKNPTLRVVIVEDQELANEAFFKLLNETPGMTVTTRVKSGEAAIEAANTKDLNLILMDIELEGVLNGIEATQIIKNKYPHLKVLLFSTYIQKKYVCKAMKSGVDGFISKNNNFSFLTETISKICNKGEKVFCSEVLKIIPECLKNDDLEFSERERQVICLTGNGLKVQEIADKLFLSYSAIEGYQKRIRKKLGFDNVGRLVAWAAKQNYCDEFDWEEN